MGAASAARAVGGDAMKAGGPAEQDQVWCPACGARDVEVTRPGWAEGLREWLGAGGPWRPTRQVCGRCGTASTAGSSGTLVGYRRGWRSVPMVPVQLVGILRRRRTMIPVPATYLTAVVVGAALGVAVELVLGWRWWLVTAGVVAAVWLYFLSTALWGGGGSSRSLATEVLRVVSPARAMARDQREEVERFRAAPFPLYGLPASWSGPRQLGGWAGGGSEGQLVTTALELGHGDPLAEEGPQLRVEVSVERLDTGLVPAEWSQRRRDLAEELWLAAAVPARDPAEHWQQVATARSRPDGAWLPVPILVEGRPVAFAWLAEGRHWVAQGELEGRTLTLRARDLPVGSVQLVRVTDVEPYLEGRRRLEAAWARHYAEEH
jgi:hypothetical protein